MLGQVSMHVEGGSLLFGCGEWDFLPGLLKKKVGWQVLNSVTDPKFPTRGKAKSDDSTFYLTFSSGKH